jgi:aminoglycoside phosphotransferase (APT) family kinase protein
VNAPPQSQNEAELESVLDGWRGWGLDLAGRPRVVARVPGGRTNRSFRLAAPGLETDLLLRLNHPDPARLGIDRDLERDVVARTAAAGVGRPFLHWDPAHRFVLFPWLDARAWTDADLARPAQRDRLWPLLDLLGAIERPVPRRRYHDYLCGYWRRLSDAGGVDAALAAAWAAFEPRLRAFDAEPWPAPLVHHDLVPANVLDTGDRLVLIDWEYAAPGHPDIDRWSVDPDRVTDPFVAEMMEWINGLWERLVRLDEQAHRSD